MLTIQKQRRKIWTDIIMFWSTERIEHKELES